MLPNTALMTLSAAQTSGAATTPDAVSIKRHHRRGGPKPIDDGGDVDDAGPRIEILDVAAQVLQ